MNRPSFILGILGAIGAGKSTAARFFRDHGAIVISADDIAHDALDEPRVIAALTDHFGHSILLTSHKVDRKKLAKLVFGDTPVALGNKKFLESILHPIVHDEMLSRIAKAKQQEARLILLDVPLLLEVGWDKSCDALLYIDSDEQTSMARCKQRGWSDDEYRKRQSSQMDRNTKRSRANFIVMNNGTLPQLFEQLQSVFNTILSDK